MDDFGAEQRLSQKVETQKRPGIGILGLSPKLVALQRYSSIRFTDDPESNGPIPRRYMMTLHFCRTLPMASPTIVEGHRIPRTYRNLDRASCVLHLGVTKHWSGLKSSSVGLQST